VKPIYISILYNLHIKFGKKAGKKNIEISIFLFFDKVKELGHAP